ncbi:MAG: hypothetical protein HFI94_00720 [Lachnospiraceae bacterium]|jgi:sugar (pentulose or hexulose) kinase|nr:hypothetical protein [Lachnospiraceae bacterium]
MYFIGLDIGTTGCKSVVFDETGASFGKCYEEFDIICRRPGWAEQSPAIVLDAVKRVMKESIRQTKEKGALAEEFSALSISVLGEEIMPVDKEMRPLRDAILGMDYRASEQTQRLIGKVSAPEAYDITGFVPHPMASLPTIMWMRDHEPELIPKTYKYVTFSEYIMKCLGAEAGYIDYPQAGRTMASDIEKKCWSEKMLRGAGIDKSMFCYLAQTGSIVGHMSKEMAAELGVTDRVALVAGGQDQTCAALGAGLTQEGIGMDSHGTIEGIGLLSHRKVTDETALKGGVSCYAYTIPDQYFLMSSCQVGGLLLKWFKNNFSHVEIEKARQSGRDVYDVMTDCAPKGPSDVMVLPHFIGSGPPWNDLDSRGAIVGLTIDSTRHDIVKAIMDSLTYEFKINMQFYESMGFRLREMRVVGGASKSPLWMQLKANILNREVASLREKDAACLGAAMIAMWSRGVYASLEEAAAACVRLDRVFSPDSAVVDAYGRAYEKYTHLYDALKEFNRIKI